MAALTDYTQLFTSEHRNKPNYLAWMSVLLQGQVDNQNVLLGLSALYDIDTAVGDQLDTVGIWVGISRVLQIPITGVFFSWGIPGVGWGEGNWKGRFDSATTIYRLADSDYRTLLFARIAANYWNGSIPSAYAVWAIAFSQVGYTLLMQDNQDMTITVLVFGAITAVQKALLTNGELGLIGSGVGIRGYLTPSVAGTPAFGWGANNSRIGGWGVGSWVKSI